MEELQVGVRRVVDDAGAPDDVEAAEGIDVVGVVKIALDVRDARVRLTVLRLEPLARIHPVEQNDAGGPGALGAKRHLARHVEHPAQIEERAPGRQALDEPVPVLPELGSRRAPREPSPAPEPCRSEQSAGSHCARLTRRRPPASVPATSPDAASLAADPLTRSREARKEAK